MERTSKDAVLCCMAFFSFWAYASAFLSPNVEVQALMEIKEALHDPQGVLNRWDEIAADPCSWSMITCSSDIQVTALAIPAKGLSGTMSPSIGNLTHLQTLLLYNNNISGTIPSEIGGLPKLQIIDLSRNLLTGEIPTSLANLKSLQYLRLNNNSLTGTIPLSLANMTQLTFLDLSFNNLSGPVPRLMAKTFKILGNPMICATKNELDCNGTSKNPLTSGRPRGHKVPLAFSSSLAFICLLILGRV